MTEADFERRLRTIEDWCIKHDVRCDNRDERTIEAIEALKKSVEKEATARKITDKDLRAMHEEIGNLKVKLAFIAGLGAAGGGVIGSALFQAFLK